MSKDPGFARMTEHSIAFRVIVHEALGISPSHSSHTDRRAIEPDLLSTDAHPGITLVELTLARSRRLRTSRHVFYQLRRTV
jgi:hypothetical protein